MAFNLNEFRSVMHENAGLQKLNKFFLRFHAPPGLVGDFQSRNTGGNAIQATHDLEFYCHSADLPGMGLATRPITRYGYGASEKKPFAPMFQDVMMIFYADGNNVNLQFFHDWFQLICRQDFGQSIGDAVPINGSPSYPYELAYKHEYVTDASVRLFDNNGQPTYEMIMRDFYPIAIPETKMDWIPTQQIMSLVVMFTYMDWSIKRDSFDTQPAQLATPIPPEATQWPDYMLKNNVW